jgi:putative ABC transport system permease protein
MRASLAWRMAWRETRAAAPKFLFVIFGVAAGVGALSGVRGFSSAFDTALHTEARAMMGADLAIRQFDDSTPAQQAALDRWLKLGARETRIVETVSMLSTGPDATPVLVSVKAVDPNCYPWYGTVRLDPDRPLRATLAPDALVISDDLVARLNLQVGSSVKLGAAQLRVAAIVRREPDRMTGSLNVGSRVMLSTAAMERTGLVTFGSRASHRTLIKLPARGIDITKMRDDLKRAIPSALVYDYRENHPFLTRALERATTFLSLVSMIALMVGALGVAMAIHTHIQQRLDTIAILKCLGARSSRIIRVYTLQTTLLGLAGGIGGVAVGAVVQRLFPLLLARYFDLTTLRWSPAFAIEGVCAGTLVALLFTLPPLLAIRDVKPALIFRREMPEVRSAWRRLHGAWPAFASGAAILLGLGAVAGWLAQSPQMGAWFVAGLAAALLLLAGVAWLLLRLLRAAVNHSPVRLPVAMRHGMANLYRPGNHATSVLVALGIGVMFTLTIYLVQKSLLIEVAGAAPPGAPNVFVINVTSNEQAAFQAFLKTHPEGRPSLVPIIPARLVSIDGHTPEPRSPQPGGRRPYRGARQASYVETQPEGFELRQGAFWKSGDTESLVSVSDRSAEMLGIRVGSTLDWECVGTPFRVRVVAIHRWRNLRMGADNEFVFNRAALGRFPAQWIGTLRLKPETVAAFQRESFRRFPSVTVVNAADIMNMVQEVVDQVAIGVRFISAFAILAGAIILASTVAGTRLRRARESAVLKTLGARRSTLTAIFSIEFAILGGVAGLMGGALATLFARGLLKRFLDASFRFEFWPNLVTILATAALAVAAGWLASLRILRQRPLEVLRDE